MSDYQGNIVIKNPATPTGPAENGSAPGIWKLSEVLPFVRQGIWPTQGVQAKDPFFTSVSLLLSTTALGNANNNLFVDSSGAFNPVSRIGNTTQGSLTPYSPNWSNYFNGTNGRLSVADNAAFGFGTGNFTIEFWLYYTGGNGYKFFFVANSGSGNYVSYGLNINTLTPWVWNNGNVLVASSNITPNTWQHHAVVRNGSTLTIYLNGVAIGSTTWTVDLGTSRPFTVGWNGGDDNQSTQGYFSNVRVVKGTAVYTANFTPPTAPLTAISGTSLLTCQSNRFRDASANNFTITTSGGVNTTDFVPFAPAYPGMTGYNQSDITNWSGYFDGSGDWLASPSSSAFAFGTGDYTLEGWFYTGATGTERRILYFNDDRNNVDVTTSNTIIMYDGAVRTFGTIVANAWNHFAVSRASGTVRCYLNGVLGYSGSETSNTATRILNIGATPAGNGPFSGYISNIRIVKGTAVYTGASLTVPTSALTAISGTSLLTCQNAAFTDNSTNNFPITITGNTTVTGNSPFNTVGYWSNYFDGSSTVTFSQINMAGDFTIEGWAYFIGTNSPTLLGANPPNHQSLRRLNTGKHYFYREGVDIVGTIDVPLNQWVHLAATRSGGTVRIFTNGVLDGSRTITGTFSLFCLGGVDTVNDRLTGYTSNMRVVDGTALYTATFTPPTAPLTAVSGTALLTSQNGSFIDNSASNRTLTRNGSPSVQSFDPFYTSTIASNGGSMYFDGSGDYLSCPSNPAFNLGTSSYTVEFFIYTSSTTNQMVFDTIQPGISGGGSNRFFVYINTSQRVVVGPATNTLTSSSSIQLGAWNHVAVVRSGTTRTIYINGVAAGSSTQSEDLSSSFCTIGFDAAASGTIIMNGYLSNLRVTKGAALYTANFTPPTAPLTPSANTSLLTNGMNAGVYDATTINDIETLGDTRVLYPTAFAPANYYGGAFDGNGDYLTSPSNSAFAFGTGDYTVECWIYATSTPSDQGIYEGRSTGSATDGFTLTAFSGSVIRVWSGGVLIASSGTSYVGQWTHVAVTRASGTTTLWINGVSQGTSTTSYNCTNTDAVVGGGRYTSGTTINTSFPGLISNFRIVKGTAVYTSAFTPSTTPLTAISGTSLLTCQNKTFIDNSSNAFTITANGNATAGAVGPFTATGGTSIYFDGTTDYMVVSGNKADWTWVHNGLQNWTIEFWAYNVNTNDMGVFCTNTNSINGAYGAVMGLNLMNGAGSIGGHFTRGVDGARMDWYTAGNILSPNQWNHVALQFNATTKNMEVYLNGVSRSVTNQNVVNNSPTGGDGSAFAYSNEPPSFNPNLGRVVGGVTVGSYFNGYIEEMRITRGIRRYTSNFTPPTQPFPIY